jgi:hypothetical protein
MECICVCVSGYCPLLTVTIIIFSIFFIKGGQVGQLGNLMICSVKMRILVPSLSSTLGRVGGTVCVIVTEYPMVELE